MAELIDVFVSIYDMQTLKRRSLSSVDEFLTLKQQGSSPVVAVITLRVVLCSVPLLISKILG